MDLLLTPGAPAALRHGEEPPSPWVQRFSGLVRPGGSVLDVACGYGRHLRWFADRGHPVWGVDRDAEAVAAVASLGTVVQADIESGPWPFGSPPRSFDAVVVTHYLWRALMPTLLASLAPGGVLLYETFAAGHETIGRPSRADFLLRRGELLQWCQGLRVVAYEDGYLDAPPRHLQRIVAVRESPDTPTATPYPLQAGALPPAG